MGDLEFDSFDAVYSPGYVSETAEKEKKKLQDVKDAHNKMNESGVVEEMFITEEQMRRIEQ